MFMYPSAGLFVDMRWYRSPFPCEGRRAILSGQTLGLGRNRGQEGLGGNKPPNRLSIHGGPPFELEANPVDSTVDAQSSLFAPAGFEKRPVLSNRGVVHIAEVGLRGSGSHRGRQDIAEHRPL